MAEMDLFILPPSTHAIPDLHHARADAEEKD
jgi:hypothetical protein